MKVFNINKGLVGSITTYNRVFKEKQFTEKQLEDMKWKLKVIEHSKEFGVKSAVNAFEVSKRSVIVWRNILKESNGDIYQLIGKSKRPKKFRQSEVPYKIVDFIKVTKQNYPKLGKDKIKYLIQEKFEYEIGATKVQDIVNELKLKGILKNRLRMTLNGKTGKVYIHKYKTRREKIRSNGFRPEKKGELVQTDTIVISYFSKRFYLLTAIDVWNRMAFAQVFKSHSSKTASEFLKQLFVEFNYPIERVQTDNGSEFNLHFDSACKELNIQHFYNYPRSPKQNAFIERFNRSIQEEFLNDAKHLFHQDSLEGIQIHLKDYLFWYNNTRPHWGLNLDNPVRYTERH